MWNVNDEWGTDHYVKANVRDKWNALTSCIESMNIQHLLLSRDGVCYFDKQHEIVFTYTKFKGSYVLQMHRYFLDNWITGNRLLLLLTEITVERTVGLTVICDILWYLCVRFSWWRRQMEIFSALPVLCVGNSPSHRWIPLTQCINAELWCFLWSAPEQTVE